MTPPGVRRETTRPPAAVGARTLYLVRTRRRAGFGEVGALGRAFRRVSRRHPGVSPLEVFSDQGYFAAVIAARGEGPRSEGVVERLFEEAWHDAFGPISCPHHLEAVTAGQIAQIKARQADG